MGLRINFCERKNRVCSNQFSLKILAKGKKNFSKNETEKHKLVKYELHKTFERTEALVCELCCLHFESNCVI